MIGWREVRLFVRLSRPVFLLGSLLLYALGAAIVDYLGLPIHGGRLVLGLALVLAVQLTGQYLNEYFDIARDMDNPQRTAFTGGSGVLGPGGLPRSVAQYAAIVSGGLAAILATDMAIQQGVPPLAWILFGLAVVGAFSYSVPPVHLSASGYGEVVLSIVVAGLVPSFAFVLQVGEMNRLLWLATAPLIALHFAMLITFSLPDYLVDSQHDHKNLLVRLGWRTAMRMHDGAVLFGVALLAAGIAARLPVRVGWGALIALPLAAAQIWQMRRIRNGFPPRWRNLTLGAVALFALTAYFELVGFLLS